MIESSAYDFFINRWHDPATRRESFSAYEFGEYSFVPYLLPEHLLQLSVAETLAILEARWGEQVAFALSPDCTDPAQSYLTLPHELRGNVARLPDTEWLKRTNMVGINVRTVGSFWGVVNYALTLSEAQDSIHLLPIWEPGVVGSIYGMSSWQLNMELYSPALAEHFPWLNTIERQLRAVVNLLHLMGKTVGMDVIPHTDRFSEIVLSHPEHFEWIQRHDLKIVDYSPTLYEKVQEQIIRYLEAFGVAVAGEVKPRYREELFNEGVSEAQRLRILFGLPDDEPTRLARRKQLLRWLYRDGYETMPATMAPPYRGLAVDPNPAALIMDDEGLVWRDYVITEPEPMSRVFGPLTRYRLYERVEDPHSWALDFARPVPAVWNYICEHYAHIQQQYGFDFMRGDMSHVQMRPDGVPPVLDDHYDILGAVKQYIQREHQQPSFGYFAETFLAPPNVMGYGIEIDHLEAASADTTLGDLQSTVVGSAEFLQKFRQYDDLLRTRLCAPNFTVITADKDDPRFDLFYRTGNEARFLMALGITDMPTYTGLGFETRDVHLTPAPNEHYTKLFVFHETKGPKATYGPYQWGRNGALFATLTRLKLYMEGILPVIRGQPTRWLIPPDATGEHKVIAWTQAGDNPSYLFIINTDPSRDALHVGLPAFSTIPTLQEDFSTADSVPTSDHQLLFNGKHYHLHHLAAGEGRVYRIE